MENKKTIVGGFEWADLTVDNATQVRDFYKEVIGFTHEDVNMGEYNDFSMNSPTDEQTKVGICHARGTNNDIPPQWMIYFNVENLEDSMQSVKNNGGKILAGPKGSEKYGSYCFIEDPSGARCALFQKASQD
ncbi:MAG: VOC family protein [Saprospiraceae bacterium]|nr:VOC family protein [Saprospiraceae bacterium]